MRKWINVLLALTMVFALVACGSANEAPATTPAQAAETPPEVETTPEVEQPTIDYPTKPITVIVPFSAGGEHDLTARVIAGRLQEMFGWNVVIQNTTGASVAAMEYYSDDSKTDGYTLFMHSPEVMASSYVSGSLTEPLYKEFTYLGCFVYDPMVICVSADSPYNTLEELFAAAKENPEGLNWASTGASGKNLQDAENLWNIAGVKFNYVPYDDAAKARVAVLGGHADVYHAYASGAKASIEAGDLKALAVGSTERTVFWPDVPTFAECGIDVQVGLTRCWDIRSDVDSAIIDYLTEKIYECWEDETTQKQLLDMGQSPTWMTNEEMHEYGEYYYGVYSEYGSK